MLVSGHGVKVVVLDDGLDYEHPDLADNYDASISYDFNSNDDDPMPRVNTTLRSFSATLFDR